MALLAIALLIGLPVLLSNEGFSHGDAPSTCESRYDAKITLMTVDNGTQTFDPISESDLEFDAQIDQGYDVTFTLHTANVSSLNTTSVGTTWYRHSAFGFGSGMCVDNTGPDEDISMTVHVTPPSGVPDGYQQNNVEWGSWPDVVQLSYKVTWYSEMKQQLQRNDISFETPVEGNDVQENDVQEDEGENEEESDDDYARTILSPFIFNDEESGRLE